MFLSLAMPFSNIRKAVEGVRVRLLKEKMRVVDRGIKTKITALTRRDS
jgi:hypothetical protein